VTKSGFERLDETGIYVVNVEVECPKRKGARVFSSEFFLFLLALSNSLLLCSITGCWDGRLYSGTPDTFMRLWLVRRAWTL
jgi:hypothetical protein